MDRRILIIAMANSVHAAGWIKAMRDRGFKIFLLSVYEFGPLPGLEPCPEITTPAQADMLQANEIGIVNLAASFCAKSRALDLAQGYERLLTPSYMDEAISPHEIVEAIRIVRPLIVHSMETQLAGYLTLEAKQRIGEKFPYWLHSNWGSDLYHFLKIPGHPRLLRQMAQEVDGYTAECERDLAIFKELGYGRHCFGPLPNSSGLEPGVMRLVSTLAPPSQRTSISIKGYHSWSGRAISALCAIRLVADQLQHFTIRVSRPEKHVDAFAETVRRETGLNIVLDHWTPRAKALKRLSAARISIGLSITDGISTTLLEAMSLGVFPIQSNAACADEWLVHGETGFIVSPHDTRQLADCIVQASRDDDLVDSAAIRNQEVAHTRWNRKLQRRRIRKVYEQIFSGFSEGN